MSNRTHYGKLGVANLPHEVRSIWYSREQDLDECPSWKWSWEHQDRHDERIERQDLARKVLDAAPLTERQLEVIKLCIIEDYTFEDAGVLMGLTRERVRQIQEKALRLLRKHSSAVTDVPSWNIDPTVTTWSWWSLTQIAKRRRGTA